MAENTNEIIRSPEEIAQNDLDLLKLLESCVNDESAGLLHITRELNTEIEKCSGNKIGFVAECCTSLFARMFSIICQAELISKQANDLIDLMIQEMAKVIENNINEIKQKTIREGMAQHGWSYEQSEKIINSTYERPAPDFLSSIRRFVHKGFKELMDSVPYSYIKQLGEYDPTQDSYNHISFTPKYNIDTGKIEYINEEDFEYLFGPRGFYHLAPFTFKIEKSEKEIIMPSQDIVDRTVEAVIVLLKRSYSSADPSFYDYHSNPYMASELDLSYVYVPDTTPKEHQYSASAYPLFLISSGSSAAVNSSSSYTTTETDDKNLTVQLLLCLFLGSIGAHRFYRGQFGMGILYLFTWGLFGIGSFIDLIIIIAKIINKK